MRTERIVAGVAVVLLAAASTLTAGALAGAFDAGPAGSHARPTGVGSVAPAPAVCEVPALRGTVVDVVVTDMGGGWGSMPGGSMMGGVGRAGTGRMRLDVSGATVPSGWVSLRVTNRGALTHEVVVLPLAEGAQPGGRAVTADGTVDESGSLGEASRSCGAGEGDGIVHGAAGWVTLRLAAGRYELVCNLPGHYAAGMWAELDVT